MDLRRLPRVRQQDATDCGAACLASIIRFMGGRVSVGRVRQLAGTDRDGTSFTGLIRAAEAVGLVARGVRAPADALGQIPLPAIAHMKEAAGTTHFVVLYAARAETVRVMDPADGLVHDLSREDFLRRWSGVLLLVGRSEGRLPERVAGIGAAARLWRLASPHRPALVAATLGALGYTVLGLSTAVFVQLVVDVVLPARNSALLHLLGLVMAALVAVQVLLRVQRELLTLRTGQQLDGALIQGYYRHLLRLPQQFFDTMRVGEIISRLNDAVKIRRFLNETSLDLLVNLLVIGTAVPLMLLYSWQVGLLVMASIPLHGCILFVLNGANRRDQRRTMEAAADLEAHLVESVGAISTIRGLGLEAMAAAGAEHRLVRLLRPVYSAGRNAVLSGAGSEAISRITTVVLLWVGATLVLRQQLTAGQVMSLYALNSHIGVPVIGLIGANRQIQDALIAVERLFDVFDLEHEAESTTVIVPSPHHDGIHFEDVWFRFGSAPPLFRGISITVEGGRRTAIVGESGSGKSTLAALMQRQRLPDSGRVRIGGLDIRHIPRQQLLRAITSVPQEPVLFSGTLLENLVGWDPKADVDRLLTLLTALGLDELVCALPDGLASIVGERGHTLSGGQRQRVAIARAVYRQPRILILDEATSALDPAAEALVQALLDDLLATGTTVVTITHRLDAARRADRILVLEHGALAEAGAHDELLDRGGAYSAMWASYTAAPSPVASARRARHDRAPQPPASQVLQ